MIPHRVRVGGSIVVALGLTAVGIGVAGFVLVRQSWPALAFTTVIGAAVVAFGVWAVRGGFER